MSDSGNLIMELDNHIMSVIEVTGIGDRPKLVEVIRKEISELDLTELFSQADIGDSLDQRIEEVVDRLDNMPDVDDMKSEIEELEYKFDDKIPELERAVENLGEMIEENKEDWKATRGEPIATPEVDHALKAQHKRIEELEHAVMCLFEYLHDASQRQLAHGEKRFDNHICGNKEG